MRASTGNAVIDIATPRKSANDVNGTPGGANGSKSASDKPAPSTNGTTMLACEIATVIDRCCAAALQIELEADEEHEEDHAELRDDAEKRRRVRRQQQGLDASGARRPSSDGPSRMPPTTSPITGG